MSVEGDGCNTRSWLSNVSGNGRSQTTCSTKKGGHGEWRGKQRREQAAVKNEGGKLVSTRSKEEADSNNRQRLVGGRRSNAKEEKRFSENQDAPDRATQADRLGFIAVAIVAAWREELHRRSIGGGA